MKEAEATDALTFIGLDIETTGIRREDGARLIQVGVCTDEETFCSYVRPAGDMIWNEESAKVHNISLNDIYGAPPAAEVDDLLREWLLKHGGNPEKKTIIAVGWNVNSFDMPFVIEELPYSGQLISRRSVELNSVCFSLGDIWLEGSSWHEWKVRAKSYASGQLDKEGFGERYHDALYDAQNSLLAWRYLQSSIVVSHDA